VHGENAEFTKLDFGAFEEECEGLIIASAEYAASVYKQVAAVTDWLAGAVEGSAGEKNVNAADKAADKAGDEKKKPKSKKTKGKKGGGKTKKAIKKKKKKKKSPTTSTANKERDEL
jgi:hypothetical protein